MRILIWHVDSFRSTITERGRSKLVENPAENEIYVEEALIVLTSVEETDAGHADKVALLAADSIEKHAAGLKVKTIVVHPFAHLFGKPCDPATAIEIMDKTNQLLLERGFSSTRSPFGWFNRLDIKAKGHPLSRVAKRISAV